MQIMVAMTWNFVGYIYPLRKTPQGKANAVASLLQMHLPIAFRELSCPSLLLLRAVL